jgi:hypothetical protein
MPNFRVYEVGVSGRFLGLPHMLAADHDEAAVEQARKIWSAAWAIEIWNGDRLVALLPLNIRESDLWLPQPPIAKAAE